MSQAEGAVTSARELYDREPTFRAGIRAWVKARRCDLRLVDLLLECGLVAQSECARWAATEPDRPYPPKRDSGVKCGPCPSRYAHNFFWYSPDGLVSPKESHNVPRKHLDRPVTYGTDKFKTATDAILFLLDNWRPA